jgi:tetrahydrodipicolinate N-succinyltransferase
VRGFEAKIAQRFLEPEPWSGAAGRSLYCAVMVKTVDQQKRAKIGTNELLRD